jgi:hypothetical protein
LPLRRRIALDIIREIVVIRLAGFRCRKPISGIIRQGGDPHPDILGIVHGEDEVYVQVPAVLHPYRAAVYPHGFEPYRQFNRI